MKRIKMALLSFVLFAAIGVAMATTKVTTDTYVVIGGTVFIKGAPGTPAGHCEPEDDVCNYELKPGKTDWHNRANLQPSMNEGSGFEYELE